MEEIAAWLAPAATMIAACMTAANLGARVTGWGFVVFVVGSLGWVTVAVTTHQPNLLWTNGFLTLVNIAGVWRWLFRRARFDDGADRAVKHSRQAPTPSLFPVGRLQDATVRDSAGEDAGHSVDAMAGCSDGRIRYLVVREGGTAGVGERFHAVDWEKITVEDDGVALAFDRATLEALPEIDGAAWPSSPPRT